MLVLTFDLPFLLWVEITKRETIDLEPIGGYLSVSIVSVFGGDEEEILFLIIPIVAYPKS